MKQILLLAVLLITACDDDPNTPGIQTICQSNAPRIEGTWRGALGAQQVTINLDERCVGWFDGSRSWWVDGQWTWGTHQGTASAHYSVDSVWISLRMGALFTQPGSWTTIKWGGPTPIVGNTVSGIATGVWKLPTDTMNIVATFNNNAITLQR